MSLAVARESPAVLPPPIDVRMVLLTNYLRPCHVSVLDAVRRRVRALTVLVSTPMEADRDWQPEWGSLDVRVQKNWTWTRTWRHSSGFAEANFVHVPYDTLSQLRRLRPDIIFSTELGMRTTFASLFRMLSWRTPLVAICKMNDRIESERGFGRRALRRFLKQRVNYFTYNGPSCLRYLRQLGIRDDRLFYYPYYYDEGKIFRGDKTFSRDGVKRLLFVGNLNPRKGIDALVAALRRWRARHPAPRVQLIVCGRGPLLDRFEGLTADGYEVDCRGSCDDEALRRAYGEADVLAFPSLADEWGLVAIEAWGSGVPVLGSRYAQSVEELGVEHENGWFFRPDQPSEMDAALAQALTTDADELERMSDRCRTTISRFTAEFCAERLCDVIRVALPSLGAGHPAPAARLFQNMNAEGPMS